MTSRARHDRFALRSAAIRLALSAILLAVSLPAHAQTSGTDCGCTKTGDYVAPDPGVEPSLAAGDGLSPDGRFRVDISSLPGQLPATLDVVRVAGNATLLHNVSGTSWGFSPDGDRFLISDSIGTLGNQQFEYQLYDLAAATAPMIWHTGPAPFDSVRPRFSADGAVFLFAATTGVFGTSLDLLEIASRSLYHTEFIPKAPPTYLETDTDPSVSGWGFGPDPTRFVYGYVANQANGVKNFSIVNVHTRVANEVAFTAASLAAFFSPCSDVLAYKSKQLQLDETTELILYPTRNPQPGALGSQSFPFSTVDPRSTSTQHVGLLGGAETPIVPNHAGDTCPANQQPVASFDVPTSPLAGAALAFTDTSTDGDGTVVAWSWDFGDSGTSTVRNPNHTYAESGAYKVTLTVTDDDGATDTVERKITICGTTTNLSGKILLERSAGPGNHVFPTDDFALDAGSGALAQLTDSHSTPSVVGSPRYSLDGSKIAFSGPLGIWVMNADGSNRVRLTDGRVNSSNLNYHDSPVFTPDGLWVAYLNSDSVYGNGGIYFVRSNGSGTPVRVPNTSSRDQISDVAPSIGCAAAPPAAPAPGCYRVATNRYTIGSNTSTIVSIGGDGSGLTTLVGPAAFYASPRFSPDGTRLVYDQYLPPSRNVVYVLALDEPGATPVPVSSGADDYAQRPIWSPDGKAVLFTQAYIDFTRDFIYDRDVWVTDSNGCDARPLYANASTYEYGLDWKPGSVAGQGPSGISGRIFIGNLYPQSAIAGALVELSGGASATTTTDAEGNFAFENLPAGGNFTVRALSAPGFVANPSGGPGNVATFPDLRGHAANLSLNLWPASSKLSGSVTRMSFQNVPVPVSGVLVHVDGPGGPFEATTGGDGRYEFTVQSFQSYTVTPSKPGLAFDPPSSNGSFGFRAFDRVPTRIAFVSARDGNDEIYAADADGQNAANLTQDPATDRDPSWSPDGSRIAFTSDRDGGVFTLHVMDADGYNVQALPAQGREPSWSPDGTRLVYATDDGLRTIDVASGDVAYITYDGSDASPVFRPDGSGILFVRTVDGNAGIWDLDLDSGFAFYRIGDVGFDGDPAFCAANNSFAYATQYGDDTAPIQILAQYPSGGVFANGRHPSWSPDCAELAYDGAGSILRSDPRSFDTPLVISAQSDRDPAWQPKTNDLPACSNGIDDDGDQLADYPDDPGCPFSYATIENPQCDDGVDNDANGLVDRDDPKCQNPSWPYWEQTPTCGLGAELALLMPLLGLAASRRRCANESSPAPE